MSMITINDKEVHLKKALPLTLGDWEDLEDMGITPQSLKVPGFKILRIFIHHICHKANNDITDDDIRSLTIAQMDNVNSMIGSLQNDGKVNVPLSNSSTDSQDITDGANLS